jgi:multicomponent Na+:H+ antiporter subunit E
VKRLLGPALLLVVWIMLQAELSVANVVGGIIVVGLVVAVDRRLRSPRLHRLHPVGVALLVVDLVKRLVTSSVVVVRTVIRPTDERLASGVVSVPLRTDSDLVATVVADLITLTPGTLTLDARTDPDDGPRLLVHVLGLADPQEVRDEVAALEARVLRAIEPPAGADATSRGGPR